MDPKSVLVLCDAKRHGKTLETMMLEDDEDKLLKQKVAKTMLMLKDSLEQINNQNNQKKRKTNKIVNITDTYASTTNASSKYPSYSSQHNPPSPQQQ